MAGAGIHDDYLLRCYEYKTLDLEVLEHELVVQAALATENQIRDCDSSPLQCVLNESFCSSFRDSVSGYDIDDELSSALAKSFHECIQDIHSDEDLSALLWVELGAWSMGLENRERG